MEFKDVSTNKYYTLEKEENSGSVAVGHKEIIASGKKYTLLAVIPRSAGYKQEWVGNFNVGNDKIHEGSKAARDEILRYVKKYIQDNNSTIKSSSKIPNNPKTGDNIVLWICLAIVSMVCIARIKKITNRKKKSNSKH